MLAVAVSCQSSGNAQACEEHLTEDLSAVYEKLWGRRRSDSRRHSTRGRLQYKSIQVDKNTFSNKKSQVDNDLAGVRAVRTQTVESFWALSTLPGLELLWLHPSTHWGCHLVLNWQHTQTGRQAKKLTPSASRKPSNTAWRPSHCPKITKSHHYSKNNLFR